MNLNCIIIEKISSFLTEDGQISVLELLELQARARAIRSQLALEPVTKIEVNSDDDGGQRDKATKKDRKSNKNDDSRNERKRTSSVRESQDSSNNISKSSDKDNETRKTKKVKLKRNYRNSSFSTQNRDEERMKDVERREKDIGNGKNDDSERHRSPAKETNPEAHQDIQTENIKREKSSRSPSPDVIPIVAEPETLMIDDSSDEGETAKPTTDITTTKPEESANIERDRKQSEREEGELNDGDGNNDIDETHNSPESSERAKRNSADKQQEPQSNSEQSKDVESNKIENEDPSSQTFNKESNDAAANVSSSKNKSSTNTPAPAEDFDEDQNDDVISLGEDLEDEMDEQLENEVNAQKSSFAEQDNARSSKITKKKKYSDEDHSEDNQVRC